MALTTVTTPLLADSSVTAAKLAPGAARVAGEVTAYAGSSAPAGWLLCYGQAVSRTTYADLYATTGDTYGSGDGSTTFNLPDLRGRVVAGQDDMGGVSANRLTNQSGGLDGDTLGDTGGSETHTLTEAQLAQHDHGLSAASVASAGVHSHIIPGNDSGEPGYGAAAGAHPSLTTTTSAAGSHTHTLSGNTDNAGSGGAHNNVQPTIILNYIIKA